MLALLIAEVFAVGLAAELALAAGVPLQAGNIQVQPPIRIKGLPRGPTDLDTEVGSGESSESNLASYLLRAACLR